MSLTKDAIIKAYVSGTVHELFPKTIAENVYLDDTTTVAAKIAEIIIALNGKATPTDIATACSNLKNEILGADVNTALDIFGEVAKAMAENEDVIEALNAAIGNKADKSTVEALQTTINSLGSLATKSVVSESDLDSALKEKVNAASEGNHSHNNKALLDTYTQTETNLASAVQQMHSHANITVLGGIDATDIANWDSKSKVLVADTQPANLAAGDLWIQTIS